jgi:hypothetical protein
MVVVNRFQPLGPENSSGETIVQTIPVFVYLICSFCPEYPLVTFNRYLQQVPSDAIALRIMSFARMCSGLS